MTTTPHRGRRTWLHEVTDGDLRDARVPGYRPGAQARSIAATRRLLVAVWDEMLAHPSQPVQLQGVLEASGVSSSSFYERFDSVRSLVGLAAMLRLDADRREREDAAAGPAPGAVARGAAVTRMADELMASILPPRGVPREVLALGVWSDDYAARRAEERARTLRVLATRADLPGSGADDYRRTLTFLHLFGALWEQSWMIGGLVIPPELFAQRRGRTELLARLLFDPSPDDRDAAMVLADDVAVPAGRPALLGHSDRHAATVHELREATRQHLVAEGLDLAVHDIAATVHRSPASFYDTFGSIGGALADLAAAEQVARIPTQLFRPRADVAPEALVAHLAWRLRAWQDNQGAAGRRLLQAAGHHPEVATVVMEQSIASAELLVGWYGPVFCVPPALLRIVFLALLALHQHQVLWGAPPPVVTGPEALGALLAPFVVAEPSP